MTLDELIAMIVDDPARAAKAVTPALAHEHVRIGATRTGKPYFLDTIKHHVYAGDTALHIAAASYRTKLVGQLIEVGADVAAKNRRKAEPLHYAVDGGPNAPHWDPAAQTATIERLLEAGADPDAVDAGGVTPLHRAVRNRCAAAVNALIKGGADVRRKNGRGSTALMLAKLTTGRGSSGSLEAKAEQAEIVRMLMR